MKILIIGDSFAADWSVKYNLYKGWPNLLAEKYNVTNLAQAGVSEYKIYKQLKTVSDLNVFDICIVSHTSPYRVPTRCHPIHKKDKLHYNADLMLNDISYHTSKIKNIFNKSLYAAKKFFVYHYDIDFYETTYNLYCQEIENKLKDTNFITINFFNNSVKGALNFADMLNTHYGLINHLSEEGNKIVFSSIDNKINNF